MLLHLDEANNCLGCKNARCQNNCPINTPIPKVIKLYKENNLIEAGRLLFENNPLTAICAVVCPHENQCRGNCIRGIKGKPVRFHEIEYEISKAYLENLSLEKPMKKNAKVAIVGSGPAGLTAAFELAMKGYDVTIFEKNEKVGGILTYGIPEFRLEKTVVKEFYNKLISLGVKFRLNATVGSAITLDKLFEDGYKAIFIGTGVWNPRKLNIPGETFGNVHYAIDYLRSPSSYDLGDNVIVIGAGNVAMDAARSAKFYGSKNVSIFYRRGFENMTATKDEIQDAKNDDVSFNIH
ncbi:MAG: FAD-dependent oxidoreductase, partial [Clostridiaceae bacterium]|nr:FAD-dependent oxidoreductase [Clostridiaceae bacterium]